MSILIKNLFKSFPLNSSIENKFMVLSDLSLSIAEGEFITIFGPNGCGKTTLVKVLAGIEPFDSGIVSIDEKNPNEARTGLVFQNYSDSLMPWLRCRDNILFPYSLKKRKNEKKIAREELNDLLSELKIDLPLENYPYQLSGGQQQLTSILRTLIYHPDVILMDEPFSSLDFRTRSYMQNIILEIWQRKKPTIVFISHDIEEAIYLADRLVILGPLPATILDIKRIPFCRPRKTELFEKDAFFHLKRECLGLLKGKMT